MSTLRSNRSVWTLHSSLLVREPAIGRRIADAWGTCPEERASGYASQGALRGQTPPWGESQVVGSEVPKGEWDVNIMQHLDEDRSCSFCISCQDSREAKTSLVTSVHPKMQVFILETCCDVRARNLIRKPCSDSLKMQTLDECCLTPLPARPKCGGGGVIVHEKIEEPVDKLLSRVHVRSTVCSRWWKQQIPGTGCRITQSLQNQAEDCSCQSLTPRGSVHRRHPRPASRKPPGSCRLLGRELGDQPHIL